MSRSNDSYVHSVDGNDENEDHVLNHCALSHVYYLICQENTEVEPEESISNKSELPGQSFVASRPKKLSKHSNEEHKFIQASV